jgi:adenine phosphoribosyltransferase
MTETALDLRDFVRDVPDFPRPGILFKDITPLLASPEAFSAAVERMAAPYRGAGITKVVAIESRGFIFGGAVARLIGAGFVPVRKPGKLPWTTHRNEYELEYGSDALEIHQDALGAGDRVVLIDDVLATGGTAAAAVKLIGLCGAEVQGAEFLVELRFLDGRARIDGTPVRSLLSYD